MRRKCGPFIWLARYAPSHAPTSMVGAADEELRVVARVVRNNVAGSIAAVCLLLVGVSTLLVRRWVTRPVVRLLDGTARYAAGDFASVSEAAYGEEPVDEVERLTRGGTRWHCRSGRSWCRWPTPLTR